MRRTSETNNEVVPALFTPAITTSNGVGATLTVPSSAGSSRPPLLFTAVTDEVPA